MPLARTALFLCALILLHGAFACDDSSERDNSGGADGGGDADGDGDGDADGDSCDESSIGAEQAPVNMMILEDMSDSMRDNLKFLNPATPVKWNVARTALIDLLESWKGQNISFGLDIFPDGGGQCAVDAPVITDCAEGNEDGIISKLQSLSPEGMTPLWLGMDRFADPSYAPGLFAGDAQRYLLVVSDGMDMCDTTGTGAGADVTPADLTEVTARLLADHQIRTMVIGFGSGADPQQLNAIAAAGGSPFTTFIKAGSKDELEAALGQVAGTVAGCTWHLPGLDETADRSKVNFYFEEDDELIYMVDDCTSEDGWTWTDETQTAVEFCGEVCDEVQSTDFEGIKATFGCKTIAAV